MNFSDAFLTLLQQTTVEKPSLFPFPFPMHLTLVCLGAAFFVYRYTVQKRPNQMLMAIAMIISLAVWLSESRVLYYAVGVMELVLNHCIEFFCRGCLRIIVSAAFGIDIGHLLPDTTLAGAD